MNAVANVAAFQPPRLPFNEEVERSFGVSSSAWKALVEAVFPLAKTADSVVMALSYCKARNLDPFKKPVHIVPMWDSKGGPEGRGGYVETVWPGISEIRTTAFRTGQYAGCDETEFGPTITETFVGDRDVWENRRKTGTEKVEVTVTFPEWARLTVYRELGGTIRKFVGPKVYWLESYAQQGKMDVPNTMWADRPIGQLEKCAEAAALRKAFPEEIGNDVTAEEMHGRRVEPRFDEDPTVAPVDRRPPAAPAKAIDAEPVKDQPKLSDQAAKREPSKPAASAPKEPAYDGAELLKTIGELFDGAENEDAVEAVAAGSAKPHFDKLRGPDQQTAIGLYEAALKRVASKDDEGEDAYDPKPILKQIKHHFDTCDSEDRLELVREKMVMPLFEQLTRSDQERATHLYNQAQERIRAADAAAGQQQDGADAEQGAGEEAAADEQQDGGEVAKALDQMSPEEYAAYVREYAAAATDGAALKTRWFGESTERDKVLGKTNPLRTELKNVVFARCEELREGA